MIENEARYEAGKQAAIRRNRKIGGRRKFEAAHDDAQQLIDWLEGRGEFADLDLCKDPDDQASYDEQKAAIERQAGDISYSGYWQDLDELAERFDARRELHPLRKGMFNGDFGQMLAKFADALDEWGGLTDKQAEVVRKALAKRREWEATRAQRDAERRAEDLKGVWVGEPKERRDWTLTVSKVLSFEGEWGWTYINLCRDQDNNQIVYKGNRDLGEGSTVKLKATVKAHDTRDGVKQTLFARPKLAE